MYIQELRLLLISSQVSDRHTYECLVHCKHLLHWDVAI